MEQVNNKNQKKEWYTGKWPFLAWLETIVKSAALGIGIYAIVTIVLFNKALSLPAGTRLIQFIIQAVLALGLVAAIFDRFQEHEIIAMGFVILNNFGHIGVLLAMANNSFPTFLLVIFWGLMLLGDVIKLFFLRIHRFTAKNASPAVMYGLTTFYLIGYLTLIALQPFS